MCVWGWGVLCYCMCSLCDEDALILLIHQRHRVWLYFNEMGGVGNCNQILYFISLQSLSIHSYLEWAKRFYAAAALNLWYIQ